MFLSSEQAEARLNSADNIVNRFSNRGGVEYTAKQRQPQHSARLPQGFKAAIQDSLNEGNTIGQVAQDFGVSSDTVSKVKANGIHDIHEQAMSKMLAVLGLMNNDKIDALSADKQGALAANLSRVIEKTSPKSSDERLQIHIHVPVVKTVADYEIVDVQSVNKR